MLFLSPGSFHTRFTFLPGVWKAMGKFGDNFSKEVTNENNIFQETFNENTKRDDILLIIHDIINPKVIREKFPNVFIILAGHGEPGSGNFQVNERHAKRLFVSDLDIIVKKRRRTDEGKKK